LQKFTIKVDISKTKIDSLSYDIKDDWLYIHLNPKQGTISKKELRTAQSSFKYDLIITLNSPDLESLGDIFENNTDLFYRVPIINIDHQAGNEHYGATNLVELNKTSAGEIVYFLFKSRRIFEIVLTSIMVTCYLGLIGYILIPCLGPVLHQQDFFTKDLIFPNGELYINSEDLTSAYIFSRGSFHCFPSLHFGVTFVWLFLAWKYLRQEKYFKLIYYLHWPVVILLWLATLYLRWHYLVDWLGGLIVALLGIWLGEKLVNWWQNKQQNYD